MVDPFTAALAGEALKGGLTQTTTATSSAKSDAWFNTGSAFNVNTGGNSPLLMAAAIAALVLVAIVALRKR